MSGLIWMLAWLLPTAMGTGLCLALAGRPQHRQGWVASLGAGFVLGSVLWGGLLRLAPGEVANWPWMFLPLLLISALLLTLGLRRSPLRSGPDLQFSVEPGVRAWAQRMGWVCLLLYGLALAIQAVQLPTLAWDAWTVWVSKAQAWAGAGQVLPSLDFGPWWQSEPGSALYSLAAHYPEAMPRYALWLGSAGGGWDESRLARAWPMLWLALGMLFHGHLRTLSMRPLYALAASLVVLTLPLIGSHVALFGYADLWLAGMLLIALIYGLRAQRFRSRGDLAMAVLACALLPAVKLEGAIWALCLVTAGVLAVIPRRVRHVLILLGALSIAAAFALGGFSLPLPGLGWVKLEWGAVTVGHLGRLELYWRAVSEPVLSSLFVLPNWWLFWPTFLLVLLWRAGVLRSQDWLRSGGRFLLFGYAFVFLLFFFTDASHWAENLTSVNRVLLQIVPATAWWAALLFLPDRERAGRWS